MKTIDPSLLRLPKADQPTEHPDNASFGLPPTPRSRLLMPFRAPLFGLGLLMLIGSGGTFLLYDWLGGPRQESSTNTTLALMHYAWAWAFSIALFVNGFLKFRRSTYAAGRPARWLGLLLWLISAYALNRELTVFQQSTPWLCWALVMVGGAMVAYAWKEVLSVRAQQLLYAVLAFGFCLFGYIAIYVAQLYPVSFPLLIGLGLSLHTFVPLAFAFALGKRLWQDTRREEHLRLGVNVGLALPVVVTVVFLVGWDSDLNRIERIRQEAVVRKTSDLPDWVLIAQGLKPGWVTNRLLLSGRTFDRGRFFDAGGWSLDGLTALDDARQHDPLVVIASRMFPYYGPTSEEQLNILKVISENRHGTEEKFWTGRHLTTEDVVSQVRIWPQFRLSYTEKTIRIRNQARNATEEALFTFHLPPGSVVSAMSLWVNGREEPARLTTVAKADSAYRQVVGVESLAAVHDPSVVYWQEGNRVTVRVFPCRAGEDRRVKLGITSPLRLDGENLVYQNPDFEGPDARSADELVKIDFDAAPDQLKTPWLLDRLEDKTLTHRGNYDPDWSLRFAATPLSTAPFRLDGRAYRMEPYQTVEASFTPADVYFDVNAAWSRDEFMAAFGAIAGTQDSVRRAWVFDDGLKELTTQNLDATYDRLSAQPFSLFPVYRIQNPASALLITKGTPTSPRLSDLQGSQFAEHFGLLAKQTVPIQTFCLQLTSAPVPLSPYLKTLAELRVLNVAHGTTDELTKRIVGRTFPRQPDASNRVVLPEAGVAIRETPTPEATASVVPDHLARLFTYNHLLGEIGRQYFAKNYQTDALIAEAQRAHVVSPLSSLIVLETAADYERFGVKKDFSGLTNATLKEEGTVPEPHEWALLAMVAGLVGWLIWKKRYGLA